MSLSKLFPCFMCKGEVTALENRITDLETAIGGYRNELDSDAQIMHSDRATITHLTARVAQLEQHVLARDILIDAVRDFNSTRKEVAWNCKAMTDAANEVSTALTVYESAASALSGAGG